MPALIILWSHASDLFKHLAEIIGIFKAQLVRDLVDQVLAGIDQLLGVLDLYLGNVVGDCSVHIAAEGRAEITGTDL